MQAELKQSIEDKTRALSRALDELQESKGTRENVTKALLELIKVVCPVPQQSESGKQSPTPLRQIVRYIASLLQPTHDDQQAFYHATPEYQITRISLSQSPVTSNECIIHETAVDLVDSSVQAGNIQPSPLETGLMDVVISEEDLAAIFATELLPDHMPGDDMSPPLHGFGDQYGESLETLLAMVPNIENSTTHKTVRDSPATTDDALFVPQSNAAMDFYTQPQVSPEIDIWKDLMAEPNSILNCRETQERHRTPFGDESRVSTPPYASLSPHSFVLNPTTLSDIFSLDHSVSSPPTSATLARNLEDFALDLEKAGLDCQSIETICPSSRFQCSWASYDGRFVQRLLKELTTSDQAAGAATLEYFARKLTAVNTASDTWIGRLTDLKELQQCPQRLLLMSGEDEDCSLVEIQQMYGKIIHYLCRESVLANEHDTCTLCAQIRMHITQILQQQGRTNAEWDFQSQVIESVCDTSGLIWITRRRVSWANVKESVPPGYRLDLAREVLHDFKAAQSTNGLLRAGIFGTLPTTEEDTTMSVETFWTNFGFRHGYESRLWDRIRDVATRTTEKDHMPMGITRASELVQLAINIGSPDVLISLKECMRQIRGQLIHKDTNLPETPWGTFDAYRLHQRNQTLSAIGLRLSTWKLQQLRKEHSGNLESVVDLILEGKPSSVPVSRDEVMEALKGRKKASYWSHLVDYVGNHDPNILCLLPRFVSIGPPRWHRRLNATSYRDLSVRECKILGEIYTDFRSQILRSADKSLCQDLLYMKDPGGLYRIEDLSYESITQQQLSSDFYVGILQKFPIPES
ncbi:uncharacterized protein BP01DRAFT_361553 [Aspergillus saccharolyticus JOP 1030-1]|uniref:Uncharacterized protein n=1 Tax=Aspergillus saccharolyticus JOP 1030-1 TaxID=1450539 RepID=A0A318Z5J6_9EURO|nr:hypothetical protein BP01DRAFT_361553 [Aspergillus saccharolyticus JOP 1030-1]PYH40083.1 hypothetical protein BP01DRAFT_361553 [Aspergillus saccharolyticus JOP 1030-1]